MGMALRAALVAPDSHGAVVVGSVVDGDSRSAAVATRLLLGFFVATVIAGVFVDCSWCWWCIECWFAP
jgi:hypothetical protein